MLFETLSIVGNATFDLVAASSTSNNETILTIELGFWILLEDLLFELQKFGMIPPRRVL